MKLKWISSNGEKREDFMMRWIWAENLKSNKCFYAVFCSLHWRHPDQHHQTTFMSHFLTGWPLLTPVHQHWSPGREDRGWSVDKLRGKSLFKFVIKTKQKTEKKEAPLHHRESSNVFMTAAMTEQEHEWHVGGGSYGHLICYFATWNWLWDS